MSRSSVKQVYIRSRRPHHPALRFATEMNDRFVLADQFENGTKDECWTLKHLGNDIYHIYCGEWYLYASPDGEVCCRIKYWLDSSYNYQWKIEYTRKGYVSIKSCFNKYLCADENFRLTADREHCELWEQWMILDKPHLLTTPVREVYIRSCQKQSLLYDDALPALSHKSFKATNYDQATRNEKWHIVCIDDNKVALFTRTDHKYKHNRRAYLVVNADGTLSEKLYSCPYTYNKENIWTIENVEGASKSSFALKSPSGHYLRCDNGDHFMCDGSVKADSEDCGDERTWWVFSTDPSDVCGVEAMRMDEL